MIVLAFLAGVVVGVVVTFVFFAWIAGQLGVKF